MKLISQKLAAEIKNDLNESGYKFIGREQLWPQPAVAQRVRTVTELL